MQHSVDTFVHENIKSDLATPFENEYQAQSLLHSDDGMKAKMLNWTYEIRNQIADKSDTLSNGHREKGNLLFRSDRKGNALRASQYYTLAILTAPHESVLLALAYANRSAANAEFGYFKEAFDDCQSAINSGYPKEKMPKLLVRQTYCASKMKDIDKLRDCLVKLRAFTLSSQFEQHRADFERDLKILEEEEKDRLETNGNGKEPESIKDYKKQTTQISSQNGRNLSAQTDISKGERVLVEKAFAFVAIEDHPLCSMCGIQSIIPFPCTVCCKVFYCSLNCKQAHNALHKYECFGLTCGLLASVGVSYLGLITTLTGISLISSDLQTCSTALELWNKIEEFTTSGHTGYPEILALTTNFKQLENVDIQIFSMIAGIITNYLMVHTDYFNQFAKSPCSLFDWSVIISSLILRHSLQLLFNGHTAYSIGCRDITFDYFAVLDIWQSPRHIKKGILNTFSQIDPIYVGNFPYTSICNHSCDPSFKTKFDKSTVTALAKRDIKQGTEIFNSYILDYKYMCKAERRETLKTNYRFDCNCQMCSSATSDFEYFQYHKYGCEHCSSTFAIPDVLLYWWGAEEDPMKFLTCPSCKEKINLQFYWQFIEMSEKSTDIGGMLEIFNKSNRVLVGFNEVRQDMASILVDKFFKGLEGGIDYPKAVYKGVSKVINYWLNAIEDQADVESLMYAAKSTFALDFMAISKWNDFDLKKIRDSYIMLPEEFKEIFNNYIDDYIVTT